MNPMTVPDGTPPSTEPAVKQELPALAAQPLSIRIIGVGGAGGNVVAQMAGSDLRQLRLVALHTSARILAATDAPEKILIGGDLTHGLGAGGDPSLARAAAERDVAILKDLCAKVDLLFIVTGLGGGTGTGVAPVLARVAKESGALVVGVATLPFEIEGPRRKRQAQQGLAELKAAADTVICFANQKIFRIVDENTSVLESLKIANEIVSQGIRGIWQMLTRPSLLHVDFAHLRGVLRDRHGESSFASVEADGEGRARELIDRLLASPLLDGGEALADAEAVLVNLIGGPDLSMADVKRVMDEINRRTDSAQMIMGASVAGDLAGKVGLTLVVSRKSSPAEAESAPPGRFSPPLRAPGLEMPDGNPGEDEGSSDPRFCEGARPVDLEPGDPLRGCLGRSATSGRGAGRRLQQGHLPLQIISKGRFEKSHPTLHRGEDLDIPTYVRRGIALN